MTRLAVAALLCVAPFLPAAEPAERYTLTQTVAASSSDRIYFDPQRS